MPDSHLSVPAASPCDSHHFALSTSLNRRILRPFALNPCAEPHLIRHSHPAFLVRWLFGSSLTANSRYSGIMSSQSQPDLEITPQAYLQLRGQSNPPLL